MNTQNQTQPTAGHEIELERQGFMEHMNERQVDIERDLLILEIAKRLKSNEFPGAKLSDELRFSAFVRHCKKYGYSAMNFLNGKKISVK